MSEEVLKQKSKNGSVEIRDKEKEESYAKT